MRGSQLLIELLDTKIKLGNSKLDQVTVLFFPNIFTCIHYIYEFLTKNLGIQ
jgi:hypothetical protein